MELERIENLRGIPHTSVLDASYFDILIYLFVLIGRALN